MASPTTASVVNVTALPSFRFVGYSTGAPDSGTFQLGDLVLETDSSSGTWAHRCTGLDPLTFTALT